jgi:hypothetical protein
MGKDEDRKRILLEKPAGELTLEERTWLGNLLASGKLNDAEKALLQQKFPADFATQKKTVRNLTIGCGGLVVLLVGGCTAWAISQGPTSSDTITKDNVKTVASHNFMQSGDQPYLERGMQRLGNRAIGKTLGQVVDEQRKKEEPPEQANSADAGSNDSGAQQDNVPDAKPLSASQRKKEFLAGVDEAISGKRISGNPYKFVGSSVDLHGTVVSVVDETHFNLQTGDISMNGEGDVSDTLGNVVIECQSSKDLEQGQRVRVLGTVIQPIEGNNAMGGTRTFAAVRAEFIE